MAVTDPSGIVSMVRDLKFPNTFNPYVERCEQYDRPRAPEIRAGVLLDILCAAGKTDIDAIWIGRDLGHRGGRRTGLALTDDFWFSAHARRWGVDADRPTRGPIVRERTATIVWEVLELIEENVFLWNVFPLHPFPEDDMYGNRAHIAIERDAGMVLVRRLVAFLRPRRIIAIGRDSARALGNEMVEVDVWDVRHPSYGGERRFREQIASLYGLGISGSQPCLQLKDTEVRVGSRNEDAGAHDSGRLGAGKSQPVR